MGDHSPVGGGIGVVELVDHHVVERGRVERGEVAGERLDAGEHHIAVGLSPIAGEVAERARRADAAVDVACLAEDLVAVGDEQHPPELGSGRVERCQPGLAEPGGHHHQSGSETLRTGLFQRAECLALHRCGSGFGIEGHPADGLVVGGRRGPSELALPVGRQPRGIERHRAWVGPQPLELVE